MNIFDHFNHLTLSHDQQYALAKLESFLYTPANVFILKGYAGSGKTTILKGLVDYLSSIEKDFALMAPTGRAAKVIREKTGQEAFTIHKSIYSYEDMVEIEEGDSFYYNYKIRNSIDVTNKIFIVDEASMLSDAKSEGEFFRFGTGHLLSDLITYTRVAHPGVQSKIIFVGDPCQLLPVGDNSSRAFDAEYLKTNFGLSAEETEMKEVKRQDGAGAILTAAAKIRKSISSGYFNDFDLRENGRDIYNPSHETFLDTWQKTTGSKIIIASQNKTCLDLNKQIRQRKYGDGDAGVQKGDIMILGGNNYRKNVFNGEFAVVNDIGINPEVRIIALRGKEPVTLKWRDVELVFPDAESNNKIVNGKMLENFLNGDNSLSPLESQALYVDFTIRHKGLKAKTEEFKQSIIHDEYFNCLLMKYGYTVTCHKAQGGEWDNVFTVWDNDTTPGFNCLVDEQRKAGKTNEGFYRWAYTAITRASQRLYALNPPYFNSYSTMTFIDVAAVNSLNQLSNAELTCTEIILNDTVLSFLTKLNLQDESIQLQDHCIRVMEAIKGEDIELIGWERHNYEVWYKFQGFGQRATYKTFFNGKYEFKSPLTVMPGSSAGVDLNFVLNELLRVLPNLLVKRNSIEAIINKLEFDFEIEEKFPFTKNLFDDMTLQLFPTGICIENIDHQRFRERYTFKRDQELAVFDFEYNGDGFFGRVLNIPSKTNSAALVKEIQVILKAIKDQDYAC